MLHQEFYSFLNERGLGKQLLVRGGTLRALIDIQSSVFLFYRHKSNRFFRYILLWVRVAFGKIKQIY